ncbi:hypothetical protein ACKI1J_29505 [Streptomyces scabiei]|uniref:hypothetical protein n=1 Tax=Streptomyces scabiei TaxID=1930 RepID=UPI0039F041CF
MDDLRAHRHSVRAAAGRLTGRRATNHGACADHFRSAFGVTHLPPRYVRTGEIITAAGVSAGLVMFPSLSSLIAGDGTARCGRGRFLCE